MPLCVGDMLWHVHCTFSVGKRTNLLRQERHLFTTPNGSVCEASAIICNNI